ncbi:MAG: hypothetical protein WA667_05920 [Candidatus Nitrosopolaris sp.]
MKSPISPQVANPQINLASQPQGIAVNEETNKIYIESVANGTVSVIDSNSGAPVKKITVGKSNPGSEDTGFITVDPYRNRIYVANTDTVSMIDGNNDTVIQHFRAEHPASIMVGWATNETLAQR